MADLLELEWMIFSCYDCLVVEKMKERKRLSVYNLRLFSYHHQRSLRNCVLGCFHVAVSILFWSIFYDLLS